MQSTLKLWPWVTVVGVPLSLLLMFALAYTLAYTLAYSHIHGLTSLGRSLLGALRARWLPLSLVSLNIALWALISYWRVKAGDVPFNPFTFRGLRAEATALVVAFVGLWLLNLTVKLAGIHVRTFRPKSWNLLWATEHALFGSLEEVTWRAYVLNAVGGVWGLLASSFGFGLYHLGSSWQHATYAFVAGLILGGAYMITEAFWGVFLAHGLYNFSVVLWTIVKAKGG